MKRCEVKPVAKRKSAKKTATVAVMYDFDKTLCTKNMQEYSFIPKLGISDEAFWREANEMSHTQKMDPILSYMYLMIRKSREKSHPVRRSDFVELGGGIEYFPGVEGWFDMISEYGKSIGAEIEHYIISSGLKEIIEGSSIAKKFREIYACEFLYDENGVAVWPRLVVNYTTKTQFLFRINKGVLDISDDESLNRYQVDEDRRVPFRSMIYIGDGFTDVPCMKLVKVNGGQSIAVYPKRGKQQAQAISLLKDNRVNYIAPADYTEGSELDSLVRDIVSEMVIEDRLVEMHRKQMQGVS